MSWTTDFENEGVISVLKAFNAITDLGADPEMVAASIIRATSKAVAAVRGPGEAARMLRDAATELEQRRLDS